MKMFDSIKKSSMVKYLLHKKMAGWEPPRSLDILHASDLMKGQEFCPREYAFLSAGIVKRKAQFVGTSLRVTFDHGKDLEYRLRNDWLRDHVVGEWQCRVCRHTHKTFGKYPKVNCKCGYDAWDYKEKRFKSITSGISGSIDFFIDMGETKPRLVEVKTMVKDDFSKLQGPLAEHKFRTALYLRLIAESEDPILNQINTSYASILYVSKAFGIKDDTIKAAGLVDAGFSPFKEYIVDRDDSSSDSIVNKAKAYSMWKEETLNGTKTKDYPCGICTNGLTARAQKCSAVSKCFSAEYKPVYTWKEGGVIKHPGKVDVT